MVDRIRNNTDVNKVRRRLVDIVLALEESMLREINRVKEEVQDLDTEIQEGMSNMVGSGFQANEARKYADRLKKSVLSDTLVDLDCIKNDFIVDVATLIGEAFATRDDAPVGGLIGEAGTKNFEQSELSIKMLIPPDGVPAPVVDQSPVDTV